MWFLVIILIAIIIYQKISEKNKISDMQKEEQNNINYNEKYEKKDYLLTPTELKFYKILKIITDELNLVICPQISLYEIVKNKNFKDFNKIASKSIDFVICEQNLKIKICIELDDYTHNREKRKQRDIFVNKLFNDLNIKILRIQVQNYYNMEELKNKIIENIK